MTEFEINLFQNLLSVAMEHKRTLEPFVKYDDVNLGPRMLCTYCGRTTQQNDPYSNHETYCKRGKLLDIIEEAVGFMFEPENIPPTKDEPEQLSFCFATPV